MEEEEEFWIMKPPMYAGMGFDPVYLGGIIVVGRKKEKEGQNEKN